MAIVLCIWSFFVSDFVGRFLAFVAGTSVAMLIFMWQLGGHVSVFRLWIGVEGERETARQIERLGSDWHCEHDLELEYGNWDHVVVGPPGIFLLDSKRLHARAEARDDALRAGGLIFRGSNARGMAGRAHTEIERRLGFHAPWVHAAFVVWGDFPQRRHFEKKVSYIRGEELVEWLTSQPAAMTAPQRAAVVQALRELRSTLAPA